MLPPLRRADRSSPAPFSSSSTICRIDLTQASPALWAIGLPPSTKRSSSFNIRARPMVPATPRNPLLLAALKSPVLVASFQFLLSSVPPNNPSIHQGRPSSSQKQGHRWP